VRCHHQKSIDIGLEYIICAFLFILPDTFLIYNNKKAISPYLFAFTMDFICALIAVYIEFGKARKGVCACGSAYFISFGVDTDG
jgi:hypothetical protein